MFLNCSTCFVRHTAHYQEFKNCNCSPWFYIRFWLPAAVMAQLSQRVQGLQLQFLSSWWLAVCRPKHVEQLRNIGIINSTTLSHLVGSFYGIYPILVSVRYIFFSISLHSDYTDYYLLFHSFSYYFTYFFLSHFLLPCYFLSRYSRIPPLFLTYFLYSLQQFT